MTVAIGVHQGMVGGPGNWRKQQDLIFDSYTAEKWLMEELGERQKNPVKSVCVHC